MWMSEWVNDVFYDEFRWCKGAKIVQIYCLINFLMWLHDDSLRE